MSDLIRRQDVIEVIKQFSTDNIRLRNGLMEMANHMELIPSADAVEVVRCKDCKSGRPYKHTEEYVACEVDCEPIDRDSDFFCAYGKRRSE